MTENANMNNHNGNWMVVRNCCTSGNCVSCQGRKTGKGSIRIIHGDKYSEQYAKFVAGQWLDYKAEAVPMAN